MKGNSRTTTNHNDLFINYPKKLIKLFKPGRVIMQTINISGSITIIGLSSPISLAIKSLLKSRKRGNSLTIIFWLY